MLEKQSININFISGVETLSDPYQMAIGKFVSLQNSVFIQNEGAGKLDKRNGFPSLTSLPDASSYYITTYQNGLVALGKDLKAFSGQSGVWIPGLAFTPLKLSITPLSNTASSQVHIDTAISPNGIVCATYAENVAVLSQVAPGPYGYLTVDKTNGTHITKFTLLRPPLGSGNLKYPFAPKVFALGDYFAIVFGTTIGSTTGHLQIVTVSSLNLSSVSAEADISASYFPMNTSSVSSFDGVVSSNTLFLSWNAANSGGILATSIGSSLQQSATVTIASNSASLVTVTADNTQSPPVIWTSTYASGTNSGQIVATNFTLSPLFSAIGYTNSASANLASVAQNGVMSLYSEIANSFGGSIPGATNYITTFNTPQSTHTMGSLSTLIRSVGLASKGFIVNSTSYFWSVYQSTYQSTYFLINSSSLVVAKLAYGNAPGFINGTLPSVTVTGSQASSGYVYKTSISSVNKNTNVSSTNQIAGIYSSTGIGLVNLQFSPPQILTAEAGTNLNVSGGYLWAYDGQTMAEQNFHVYPEPFFASTASGGGLSQQSYFYQSLYEWKDAKGNIFRSAPSIPYQITAVGQTTITVPTLRLTNKNYSIGQSLSSIQIKVYRWSVTQQTYYLSVQTPNITTVDSVTMIDALNDLAIVGNEILYTNGGTVEDASPPAISGMTTFDSRLWIIDAEDENLLWFSKTLVEGAPVEMSDLLTYFVPPNVSGIQSTGGVKSLAAMDDKLILFKKETISYINGSGPDNTGANSQYSSVYFITGGIGCINQNSIALTPEGLMFQSDKGIWLLGRDLSMNFIGKEVEYFNTANVLSSFVIPATNEVRFTLGSSNQTLSYDYFAKEWNQLTGIPAVSSTIYNSKHTLLSSSGSVSQEVTSVFNDNGVPTTMSFTTGWINFAGLQGYARAYRMYLLGNFFTPHTYTLGIAYNYNPQITQTVVINPTNTVGSGSIVEQWQVNFQNQQCQSFQLTFNETASSTAGAGLSLSGIRLVVGLKKDFPRNIGATNKIG